MVLTHEVGEPDDVEFRYRLNYQGGPWSEPEIFNDHDVLTGATDLEINWLGTGYGMVYIDGDDIPRFDRPDFLFADGFESGSTASWSSTVD